MSDAVLNLELIDGVCGFAKGDSNNSMAGLGDFKGGATIEHILR